MKSNPSFCLLILLILILGGIDGTPNQLTEYSETNDSGQQLALSLSCAPDSGDAPSTELIFYVYGNQTNSTASSFKSTICEVLNPTEENQTVKIEIRTNNGSAVMFEYFAPENVTLSLGNATVFNVTFKVPFASVGQPNNESNQWYPHSHTISATIVSEDGVLLYETAATENLPIYLITPEDPFTYVRVHVEWTEHQGKLDTDRDGLSNNIEETIYGTDPLDADSDGDGLFDGWEVANGLNPLDSGNTQYSTPPEPTHSGFFVLELNQRLAPAHVENFARHVENDMYDGTFFHRTGYIQGGDFENGDGSGGYAANWYGYCDGQAMQQSPELSCSEEDYTIPDEAAYTGNHGGSVHQSYSIGMVKAGIHTDYYNTGGSQFYIVEANSPTSNHHFYTFFGGVVEGFDVIDSINQVVVTASPHDGTTMTQSGGGRPLFNVTVSSMLIVEWNGPDNDLDGLLDVDDNCPTVNNPAQADMDGDNLGDLCDDDIDGDGYHDLDETTACDDGGPYASFSNPLDSEDTPADMDGDLTCDALDSDRDGDGFGDNGDACPNNHGTSHIDRKGCLDQDGDGISDLNDVFWRSGSISVNTFMILVAIVVVVGVVIVIKRNGSKSEDANSSSSNVSVDRGIEYQEWTDEQGHTWKRYSDGRTQWWNGTDWQDT